MIDLNTKNRSKFNKRKAVLLLNKNDKTKKLKKNTN